MNSAFWRDRKVLLTGHTGFKGSWLSLVLQGLDSDVVGYALEPATDPSLFEAASVAEGMDSVIGDVRDVSRLEAVVSEHRPQIVIHMAAQPLVRRSYADPLETYATNVMGTVHVLEVLRRVGSASAVLNVTSDKCYHNNEWVWGYREDDPVGGCDPYSSSKACAELVTEAYRKSFFCCSDRQNERPAVASARAGNVIGGGDWAEDRLVPDIVRAVTHGMLARIRSARAVRPWQHVLEPLSGYLLLIERLVTDGPDFAESWNFGPREDDSWSVRTLADRVTQLWGDGAAWEPDGDGHPHEATNLRLDCSKARTRLGWHSQWDLETALRMTVDWYRQYYSGRKDMRDVTLDQIAEYRRTELIRPRLSLGGDPHAVREAL